MHHSLLFNFPSVKNRTPRDFNELWHYPIAILGTSLHVMMRQPSRRIGTQKQAKPLVSNETQKMGGSRWIQWVEMGEALGEIRIYQSEKKNLF